MNESRRIENPFPGLRPFETHEYRLFFGREGQSDALLERLDRARFLAVVGSSGSGKSSLVRAGLLPSMRGGLMAGAGAGWRIAVMRPGGDPVGNLARALAEKGVLPEAGGGLQGAEAEAVIEATLRGGSLGLVEAARQARLEAGGNLLVVVDQFEELFRFRAARAGTSTGDDAAAFVKLLLEAARQRELPIYVVLTMRSDFLGDCAQFQGLPEAINDGQYLIPRLTRDERRAAITGPVGVARARIAEPLVNRLLNDVGDNPDQLPILQHALMRTWHFWKQNRRDKEPIGVEHYEAIGTMSEALSRHADEAWGELPDERSRRVAEQLFKALTEKGADNREIRRPTRLAQLCAVIEATPAEVVAVVEVFRREWRSFLMPPVGVPLEADTVIDISHESLIRNWVRLREWVNEEGESAHMYRRLAYAAESGGYISGAFLDTALDWRERHRPNAAWAERYHSAVGLTIASEQVTAFLDASRDHRDAQTREAERRRQAEAERERRELEQAQTLAEEKRQRAEEQAAARERELEQAKAFAARQMQAARRLRRQSWGLLALLLLAFVTAAFGFYERTKAKTNERSAKEYAKRAETEAKNAKDNEERAGESQRQAVENWQSAKENERRATAAQVELEKALELAKNETERANNLKDLAEKETARANKLKDLADARFAEAERAKEKAESSERETVATRNAGTEYYEALESLRLRQLDDARRKFDSSAAQFEKLNNVIGAAAGYIALGNTYFDESLDEINPDKGVEYYENAARLYRGKDSNGEVSVYLTMGNDLVGAARAGYEESGDAENARRLFDAGQKSLERALSLYRGKKDRGAELGLLKRLANNATYGRFWSDPKEAYRQAVAYYAQTLPIYEEQASSPESRATALGELRAMALRLAGLSERRVKDPSAARKYHEEAVRASRALGGVQAEADALLEISRSFIPIDPRYREYQERAAKLFRDSNDRRREADILIKIGDVRRIPPIMETNTSLNLREGPDKTKKITKVLDEGTRVLVIARDGDWFKVRINNEEGYVSSDYLVPTKPGAAATTEEAQTEPGQLDSALDSYQQALTILKELGAPPPAGLEAKINDLKQRLGK